jgi:hypothetical protein
MVTLHRATGAVANALSFSRSAMRELVRGRWRIEKDRIELDVEGRGEVLYRLVGHGWTFRFFLISNKLPEEQKLDRNFAPSWDAMGVLCQGEWTAEREAYLRREIPKQRAGRADYDTLVYARGNRSGRLFDHVVDSLAAGHQPDAAKLAQIGYVLRTTAFIGNGQLGTRPLAGFEPDHPMRRPYHAQIWSAFVLREYVFDLIDHLAHVRNPAAVRLDPQFKRYLGLGNSAATGLVPFIVNHPLLIHSWSQAYEAASTSARKQHVQADSNAGRSFEHLLTKASQYFREGTSERDLVFAGAGQVADELGNVGRLYEEYRAAGTIVGQNTKAPWQAIHEWLLDNACSETVEVFAAILLELYPHIVDRHTDGTLVDERLKIDPAMTLAQLKQLLLRRYSWAFHGNGAAESATYFWYRSAQAPRDLRRGLRDLAPELEAETPMDVTLRVRELLRRIDDYDPTTQVVDLLCTHPQLRHIAARVQTLASLDHGELEADFLSRDFLPFSTIRLVLAFFGMDKFESAAPKSVRGAFLQGAPIAEDVEHGLDGDWPFPLAPKEAPPRGAPSSALAASVTPGASGCAGTAPARRPSPASTGVTPLTVAPIELLRLLQGALQAGGVELGVAEEAAEMILFDEALRGGAVRSSLRQLDQNQLRQRATVGRRGRRVWVQDADGLSAIAAASIALDMACVHALGDSAGIGASLVLRAADPQIVGEIARRCAERGLLGVLISQHEESTVMLAGPGDPEPWLIEATLREAAPLYRRFSAIADLPEHLSPQALTMLDMIAFQIGTAAQNPANVVSALSESLIGPFTGAYTPHPGCAVAPPSGFLLLCLHWNQPAPGNALFGNLSNWQRGALDQGRLKTARCWSSDRARAERTAWHARGLRISAAEFDALTLASAKLLVPVSEEHRLRPVEGTDPLKVF